MQFYWHGGIIDTGGQVSRVASEAIQTEWRWKYELEQGYFMGNPTLLALTDSKDVFVGQDLQADNERI